jgi:hypothetical protein
MLKNIPLSRLLLYLIFLGFLPLVFVVLIFVSEKGELQELNESMESIQYETFVNEKKQSLNLSVRQHFRDADHFYIDKYLETLVFLEPEIETLQRIVTDKNFADDERIKKRLEFLTSEGNSLIFSEGVVQTFPTYQETMETLVHPVEVDAKDIQKILAKVEGVEMGGVTPGPNRPQLFITDFKLSKKKVSDKREVYILNMKFIKREFL